MPTSRAQSLVDRLLLFIPSFDSSEDAFGVSGPDEGLGIGVGFFGEPVDCSLKVGNRPEHSTLEAPPREFGDEASLRSATIASSRRRSARVTLTTGIVRMNQTTRSGCFSLNSIHWISSAPSANLPFKR